MRNEWWARRHPQGLWLLPAPSMQRPQRPGESASTTSLRTPASGQTLQPLGLAGTASFNGVVRGSTSSPHLTGQLSAQNLQVQGSAWKLIRTNIDASPSQVSLQRAELDPAAQGRIALNAS